MQQVKGLAKKALRFERYNDGTLASLPRPKSEVKRLAKTVYYVTVTGVRIQRASSFPELPYVRGKSHEALSQLLLRDLLGHPRTSQGLTGAP